MDLLSVIQPIQNRSWQQEDLKDPLNVKPLSGSTKLSVAERPSDNDVFIQPEDTVSHSYFDPFTAASILANNSPTTILPSYFDDVIVGRITCNNTANGTEYTSLLDCYNGSYAGELFNNASGNGSAIGGARGEEPLTDVILMGVTSLILGLMILITVIGEYFNTHQLNNCSRDDLCAPFCVTRTLYQNPPSYRKHAACFLSCC
jgi:hypothetical protein